MNVEWDTKKNDINIKKHGISFDLASKVFTDTNRIEYYDEANSRYEDRYITIGLVGEVLFVVYTDREDAVRLISARLANTKEKEVYYDKKRKNK